MEKEPSVEKERQQAMEELMKTGDEYMDLQFEEQILGGIRDDRLPPDTPREKIAEEKDKLRTNMLKRVEDTRAQCLGLGITQEEIDAYRVEWKKKKKEK